MADALQPRSNVEEELVNDFKCPVCFEFMFPPIRQCRIGHLFCFSCFQNIRACAVCRAPKSNAQCFALEKMQERLVFPCKYEEDGCKYIAKPRIMAEHQIYCEYSHIPCPLGLEICEWRGIRGSLRPHCTEEHPEYMYLQPTQKLKATHFSKHVDDQFNALFCVYGTIFRFSWDVNIEIGFIRFAVYCLEKPFILDRFSFQVTILQRNTDREITTLRGPCHKGEVDNDAFVAGTFLVALYDVLVDYTDDSDNLHFVVEIYDNE